MKWITNKTVQRLLHHSTLVLFIIVLTVFGLLSKSFFSFQNLINVLTQASSLGIIATGMTFVLLTAGIDLSVGSIMFLAGVISSKMVVAGFPLWMAFSVVLAVGILFGLMNGFLVVRAKIVPFIVTLATFYMGRGLGLFLSETRAINLPESFLKIGSAKLFGIPFPIIAFVLVVVIGHLLLTKTTFGKQVYAVGHSTLKSKKAGIRVNGILLKVYLICGLCASIGGLVAISQLGAVSPTFGLQSEFMAIAAAVLGGTSLFGGKGTVFPGTLVGVLLVQCIQNGLVMVNADPYLYPLITGGVIFLVVLIDSLRHLQQQKLKRWGIH
ncbi:ABC transporter permease [Ulvibacterium sp.]|uniref:ABC transporter permease n=1 Tax=Ulvibacterium sp. TaxID=2665914 RepID=UPI003BA877CB